MATVNCYDALGVSRDITTAGVKKAYRKLASQYHPDKVNSLPPKLREFADEEMRRINMAKEILLDTNRRLAHDRELESNNVPNGSGVRAPQPSNGNNNVPYTFACPHCSARVSAITIDRAYVMACPTCRKQMTIPNAPGSQRNNGGMDRMAIYREAMKRALLDGVITRDESYILDGLREVLRISPMEHQNMLFHLQRG